MTSRNYEVVVEDNAYRLEKIVEEKLKDGFVFVGGVSIATCADGTIWFAQAVAVIEND